MRTTSRSLAIAALLISVASSWALPSLQQVEDAVKAGDYAGAETMTREVVSAKPNAAKAHYILAELMAHNKELTQAKGELTKAKELDPAIHFTSLEKFNVFQQELDESIAKSQAITPVRPLTAALGHDDDTTSMVARYSVMALCIFLIIYAVSWVFRRQDPTPNPVVSRPLASSPTGLGGYSVPTQAVVQPSSGPSVLGTGLAVAGGVVAGELISDALRGHKRHDSDYRPSDDNVANNASYSPPSSNDDLTQRPIDFGNSNDWGDGGQSSSASIDLGGGSGGGNDGGWDA